MQLDRNRIRAILFDLDGTLVSTSAGYRYSVVGAALRTLERSVEPSVIDDFWFREGRDEIIRSQFKVEPTAFWKALKAHEEPQFRRDETTVFEDVETIRLLRQAGLKVGLVTNTSVAITNIELDLLGRDLFDAIAVIREHRLPLKPAPDGLLYCLSMLGVAPQEAMSVGNAFEDIVAAQQAGIFDVYLDRHEYPWHNNTCTPSLTIYSLNELCGKVLFQDSNSA